MHSPIPCSAHPISTEKAYVGHDLRCHDVIECAPPVANIHLQTKSTVTPTAQTGGVVTGAHGSSPAGQHPMTFIYLFSCLSFVAHARFADRELLKWTVSVTQGYRIVVIIVFILCLKMIFLVFTIAH